MRWKLNSDWTNLLNHGSYEIVTKCYLLIFGSNFVCSELAWIVINCSRFMICKGSADQEELFEREIKRGISMSANPLSAQPYRGATSKPELTPAAHCSSNPSCCVFPICAACSPVATVHHTAGEPADWRRYFRINFCYLWILGRHDMVIIVNLVPTLRIARCQFVPT